jgi:coenzyme PQQ precursor peptide PqqA
MDATDDDHDAVRRWALITPIREINETAYRPTGWSNQTLGYLACSPHRRCVMMIDGRCRSDISEPDDLLVGLYLTREGPSATCKRTGCGYPAPFLNNPMEDAMAWTTPTITEVCAGFEVTAYASAE